ncbi:hypothetical protein TNCT_194111 [Trichonephila clavata]|uniref:Uncharacterized protein n=1 Tax=Trichonephila clavata TaxID=2740835 RepID=A0A8X6FYS6_TRICU|nr:hypothetical protein TNCT_194111 [Trichonephila clavata]
MCKTLIKSILHLMLINVKHPFLEPAYPFTAKCMVQAGLTLLKEQEKMPLKGGVLTPGVAFGKTTIQKRLEKSGLTFTLEDISCSV